jgi:hypothetical protein
MTILFFKDCKKEGKKKHALGMFLFSTNGNNVLYNTNVNRIDTTWAALRFVTYFVVFTDFTF